jgi:restriction endonuclease S subunit
MKARLGDVCTVVSGSTPKSTVPEYWDGDIKWITPAELSNDTCIINDSARHITALGVAKTGLKPFPAGTVILSSRAPIGKTAIAGCEMFCNQGFKNLICSEKIDSKYLYYFLSGKTDYLNSLGRGATFKEISKAIVENIEIPLPEVEEQKRIAARFERLLRLIQLQKAELEELDKLVKSRFIELFGMPGTDAFGWGLVPLGSTCNINPKKSLDSRLVSGAVVSFVPMPAVTEHGEIDATAIKEYDEVKTGFTYFAENDVLFAKITPCMENGKGAVAKGLHNGIGFGSTEFHVLRPISGKTDPYWIYTLTAFSQFRMDAASNMTGSAGQRRVPASFLENYRVSLPPIALQEQFAAFVEQTDKSKLCGKMEVAA